MPKKPHAKNENHIELQHDKSHRAAVSTQLLCKETGDLGPRDPPHREPGRAARHLPLSPAGPHSHSDFPQAELTYIAHIRPVASVGAQDAVQRVVVGAALQGDDTRGGHMREPG